MANKMQYVMDHAGLGGIKERYTTGETLWMIGLSVGIGFLLGMVLIIAIVG
jgi:hypothetical protein